MPATDGQWAEFFTGEYSLLVDDLPAVRAKLTFSPTETPHFLTVIMTAPAHDWSDTGRSRFALKPIHNPGYGWPHQGDLLPGGHLLGYISHASYGNMLLLLVCWEIVLGPNGWVHGFEPSGNGVVIRFEGRTDNNPKVWFSSTGVKNRPDTNYPWNLP
jgi:hypothetical protein